MNDHELAKLQGELEEFCVALAPELPKTPVVLCSRVPELAEACGPLLGLGLAVGRITLNDVAIAAQALTITNAFGGRPDRPVDWNFRRIVVHEFGHVLDALQEAPIDRPEVSIDVLQHAFSPRGAELIGDPKFSKWHMHEAPWLRLVLHLRHRAALLGWDFFADDLIDYAFYGLSNTLYYEKHLGDEPERMAGWPIKAIKQSAPPKAFLELFESDTRPSGPAD